LGVSALVRPRADPCSFNLLAKGGETGDLGEAVDGEITLGGANPETSFYIQNGTLEDVSSGLCQVLSTGQLECEGVADDNGKWTVTPNNTLLYNNCPKFYVCSDEGSGTLHIYNDARNDTSECYAVTLNTIAYNCTALGRPTTTATTPGSTATASSTATATASCPSNLAGGDFASPEIIVPVDSENPTTAYGRQPNATITPSNSSLYNFDLSYTGTCALLFLFPFSSSLSDSGYPYLFSGIEEEVEENGGLNFTLLASPISDQTTFDTVPNVSNDYGKTEILPGNNYTIAQFPCEEGYTAFKVASDGNVDLIYSQDSEPSPLGLYVVPCA
jgi:hypothetical protein